MDIVILDLEWNSAYSGKLKGYINEIIEFGAVKCGEDLKKKDTFTCLVKPQVGKKMNPYTAELTNLTVESLSDGLVFMSAVRRFKKWAGDCVIMTWGNSDVLTLIENCRYFSGNENVPFLQYFCDLQHYAQIKLGTGSAEQLGLARAAELLGIDVFSEDKHHRALYDSVMTTEILRKLWDEDIKDCIMTCDEDFYRRITFKTTYIDDIDDPEVRDEDREFICPRCGRTARRKTRFSHRNKGFKADFVCPDCGFTFSGQLYLKRRFEGVSATKKITPLPIIEKPRAAVPAEIGNMRLDINNGVGVLRFPHLENTVANAAFTTRIGGVSQREFAALNLGFGRGDSNKKVAENYRLFCEAAGFDPDSLVAGAQDHHVNIRRVTSEQRGIGIWREKDMESIDGLCTDDENVTLVIYCADCVPIYFVDETHRAIGLAHAGWRGTCDGMAKVMAERMAAEFGTRPEDLIVTVGPSICKDCFEVDEPVMAEFAKLPNSEKFVSQPEVNAIGETKYHIDLWECNRQYLLSAEVPNENIFIGNVCTMCESDLIFSHRKTRGKRGSNCAMMSLKGES